TVLVSEMEVVTETHPKIGAPTLVPTHVIRGKQSTTDTNHGDDKSLVPQTPPQKKVVLPANSRLPLKISALNTTLRTWSIEGRALGKTSLKEYANANGTGSYFTFDFVDDEGGEIRVTCFNEIAAKFFEEIEAGKLYTIANGRIGNAKPGYNHLNNEFEIFLQASSTISPLLVNNAIIPLHNFHLTEIKDIPAKPVGSFIDVIGIVLAISPCSTIRRRDSSETIRRSLQLKDMSGFSVTVTLWGQHLQDLAQELEELLSIPQLPVLALKVARISSFNGTSIDTVSSTKWFVNPQIPESKMLQDWVASENYTVYTPSVMNKFLGPPQSLKPVATIAEILHMGNTVNNEWATLTATITNIAMDNFYYMACPLAIGEKKCRKKVKPTNNGSWFCVSCNSHVHQCDYRYALCIDLQDGLGELQSVTAFDTAAEAIMGVAATDLQLLCIDDEATTEIANQIIGHDYKFTLSVKKETFRGNTQLKCVVLDSVKLEDSKVVS
ncbi:hypothetical protein KI387_042611, partial [Taxus chinensis]